MGFTWHLLENMSDEFDGTTLDTAKWFDHVPTWRGRPPAEFLPKNVGVSNGNLEIKTSTHPAPNGPYTTAGAAVAGKHQQVYGYFVARLKASRTKMSTTFWLHSDTPEGQQKGCAGSHSIELDILETIGGWPHPSWSNVMRSNTHYKPYESIDGRCRQGTTISKGNKHDAGVPLADGFHTFAAWWVSPFKFHFYFDGKHVGTVDVERQRDAQPFNGPMSLRMVAETYDWQPKFIPAGHAPYPTEQELDNPDINTAYYDYVRSYALRAADGNLIKSPGFESSKASHDWQLNEQAMLSATSYTEAIGLSLTPKGKTRQKVAVKQNTTYRLALYGKNTASAPGARVSITTLSGTVLAGERIASTEFAPLVTTFNSKENSSLYLTVENPSPAISFVDNISLMAR
ncbi:family 16 glycosylhydrolase [Exilibacterium tricleocarpae]|nr:family 16 glycosylhydrolase [Exilibacterium tricleocarpae]